MLQATSNYAVDIVLAAILIAGGVVGAQFGVRAGGKLRGEQIRFLLALLVLAVALRLLWGLVVHAVRFLQPCSWGRDAAAGCPVLAAACRARAGRRKLVSGVSQDLIQITSNYTGSDIVVFGDVEGSRQSRQGRDIVVVVRGPDTDMTVRRRDRVAGVWINHDAASLSGMPAYYYLASSRPLSADRARRHAGALWHRRRTAWSPTRVHAHHDVEPFRQAALRLMQDRGFTAKRRAGWNFSATRCSAPMCRCPPGVTRGPI